jgi:hypothetical protein
MRSQRHVVPGGLAGAQLEIPQLLRVERGTNPCIVLAAGEKVPDDDGDFAGNGDGSHVGAAPPANAFVKGSQRPRPPNCLPRCFDQHRAGMTGALLGDPSVPSRAVS